MSLIGKGCVSMLADIVLRSLTDYGFPKFNDIHPVEEFYRVLCLLLYESQQSEPIKYW